MFLYKGYDDMRFFQKHNKTIAAAIVVVIVLAMVATTVLPYI
jgi:hypothetical protein